MGALGVSALAGQRPGAAAIVCVETGEITRYRALEARVSRLAGTLAARGVGAGDRVAIASLGRPEVFETQLACARVGAAMVPLNWRLAAPELELIAAAARPALAIADPELPPPPLEIPTLVIGGSYERAIEAAAPLGPRRPPPDEIAQVLYTSGTTGRPRGAMLPWRQLAFNAAATADLCGLGPGASCLALLPTFHTGGLNCLATPTLAAGGTVYLMKRFDPEPAAVLLASGSIDATVAVPAMYRALLEAGLGALPPRLGELLAGGASVPAELSVAFAERGRALRQGFGMTEVGPNCFTGGDRDVGHPTPGTEARVVAAPGGVGELELRGPHLFAGYLDDPAATAEAFDGDWFRTGDLARVEDSGRYTICGRRKEMFISGGENVYPIEVESALARHPAVAEIAVIGVPDPRWGEVGMAAVVWRPGVAPGDLEGFARAHLAAYKVPRHWRELAALPRTATGKVAKGAIRDLFPTVEGATR
jgi:fatty-acyl-CoA synthase